MPKFSAASLDKVEYDFTEFEDGNGKPIEDKGFIQEPSRELVNLTLRKITKAFDELGMEGVEESPEAIANVMNKVDPENEDLFEKMTEAMLGALAELCGAERIEKEDGKVTYKGGAPTYQSLEKLRYRPFMGFFGYVMGEMMSPELSKPGTTHGAGQVAGQGRTLRSV